MQKKDQKQKENAESQELDKKSPVEKKSSNKKPSVRQDSFNWTNGTKLEKISFLASLVTLVAAVVFLVFEFIHETSVWPYAWFNVTIGLSFVFEGFTHYRLKRGLSIVSFICGLVFVAIGILKLVGIF